MIKIGDRVVCQDSKRVDSNAIYGTRDLLVKDRAYTVRGIDELGGILLEGVVCGYYFDGDSEAGFPASLFRKLDYEFVEDILRQIAEKPIDLN